MAKEAVESPLVDIRPEQVQGPKWRGYPEPSRQWPTPKAIDLVGGALALVNTPPKILVCGCGGAASEAFDYAQAFPTAQVTGFDINGQATEEATERARSLRLTNKLSFSCGDVLDANFIDDQFPRETFSVVTMIGVATNLIHDGSLRLALTNLWLLLARGGSLVFSDYLMMDDFFPYWEERYQRDRRAMLVTQMALPTNQNGVFVVRPAGLSASDCQRLSYQEIATCLVNNDFERLARHRQKKTLETLLGLSGYRIVPETSKIDFVADNKPNLDEPWNLALNYTVRTVK